MARIFNEEAKLEAKFCDALRRRWPGAVTRKLNGYGHRDWPDRLVILPQVREFYIEFKKPGEALRPSQEHFMGELRKLGLVIYVCNDLADALYRCDEEDLRGRR